MEGNVEHDAMFKFRKMLYEELPNDDEEYLIESDWNKLSDKDFHENFKEQLKDEYVDSYKDLQSMLLNQGMTDIEEGISEEQFEDLKQEAQDKLINASTLATFYRMYKVFYSVIVN